MKRRVLKVVLAGLGVLLAGAAVVAFVVVRPVTVEVARPAPAVPVQVFGLGTVEARIVSKVGVEVAGTLVELSADHGDRGRAGDVLARLDTADQEARVERARAGVESAEAALKQTEAAVARARTVLVQKKQANARKQALLARQTASVETAEAAQMEADVAAADVTVALGDVEVARAALAEARAEESQERVRLSQHVLIAPYDAVVVERMKERGSVLAAGASLFTLVAPETVWALAYVDESRAGAIRVGQPAEIRLRSLPGRTFTGRVARIDIESDRVSEERRVSVACDDCPEAFHLGEQAEVLITTGVLKDAILVPETAIETLNGATGTVWVVKGGSLHRSRVTFGERTLDSRLAVTDGLESDARVVTFLRPGLREGRLARVADEEAPE
ncbi:MAG: efflux RND transporter periplasmic adaptor subunit [Rhodospirillales bacterium]|jgi:HlyD family secretion protein|nr:efflux RND transporter periplasmic adaptor subunit [Rhodospirillales bacterium]